jgi:DNA-damage-inducible protein D
MIGIGSLHCLLLLPGVLTNYETKKGLPARRSEVLECSRAMREKNNISKNNDNLDLPKETKISLFKGKGIRRMLFEEEWWFSVVDVIEALTDSSQPSKYWTAMKARISDEGEFQLSTICRQLKLEASDGKKYETDCANAEGLFRIIQSVPSPKAEPFKRWLAKVGYERVQEIENPELATRRTRALYKAKGYSDDWIEKRIRGIAIREELTDEWKNRGAEESRDYEILTAEISKATFGVTPSEYKKLKGLKRENLRDHMDDFELIFNMLGEKATTEIHRSENSKGVAKLKSDAKAGGDIAGGARRQLENRLGRSVVTKQNFLKNSVRSARLSQKKKRSKLREDLER